MNDRQLNSVVNELLDMLSISQRSSWKGLNITLAKFYRNMLNRLPDEYYEHIHEAFLTEV